MGENEITVTVVAEDGETARKYTATVTREIGWGARLPDRDIELGGDGFEYWTGLWSDGETLWVVDASDRKLYAYAVPGLRRPASAVSGLRVGSRATRVPAEEPGEPVVLPDAALLSRVEAALGKAPGEAIGSRELGALETLDLRDAGVRDLTGLDQAVNLRALDLSGNGPLDLHVLASLPHLASLNADGAVADLWALAGMKGLARLSVRENGLADITALATLRADGNAIEDVTPLAALPSLKTVDLRDNRIEDVNGLGDRTGVVELDPSGDPVEGGSASARELEF